MTSDHRTTSSSQNPLHLISMREEWIGKQMKLKTNSFTEARNLSLFVGTWNVNAKKPNESMDAWLKPPELVEQPDAYVIGFQEIVDLNAGNLLVDHNDNKEWEVMIQDSLSSWQNKYQLLTTHHLVGILLVVYVRHDLLHEIKSVQIDTVGVGIMGVGGNKGGVAVRFQWFDSTFCLVCSHLAAHQNNVHSRNSDFLNIAKRITYHPYNDPKARAFGLYDHDNVIWLGDLNYRINIPDMDQMYSLIEENKLEQLLAADQLVLERKAGRAFKGYSEGLITFRPTYKYQPGTSKYERREDKKKRPPAWCDRILWIGDDIAQLVYNRAELLTSDHKPVYSIFQVKAKVLVKEKQQEVYQNLVRQLDTWENECIPKVSISRSSIHFSNVTFQVPITEYLVIENTGQVVVQFQFTPKLQEERFCKPWLKVEPEFGIIPPGESLQVTLCVTVSVESSAALTSGRDLLEDILIFRLENGRDYFVTVSGDYLKSCFGNSVDFLISCPGPVRFFNSLAPAPNKVLGIPKELWRIVDYIYRASLDEPNLFFTVGDPAEIAIIRECLDTGTDFGSSLNIHSMADTLLRFLECITEPVFPPSLCAQYVEGSNLTGWCRQALFHLPSSHYNVFVYVISFLREVLAHSDKNFCEKDQLGVCLHFFVYSCSSPIRPFSHAHQFYLLSN